MYKSPASSCTLLCLILTLVCGTARGQSLSNPDATSDTRAVYEYLKSIGSSKPPQLILGQHAGHGSTITRASTNPNPLSSEFDSFCFDRYVQPIFDKTGEWPGVLSLDYEFDYPRLFEGYDFNPVTSLRDPNLKLKEWWSNGGLVTVNWSPANPWSPGTAGFYGTIVPEVQLRDLTNNQLPVGKKWQSRLDEIARALADLQNAGVVVLWRPMQEMDGYWFWPGQRNVSGNGEQFRQVWRHMHDYFTKVKGLNNLIWVFSPTYAIGPELASGEGAGVYPGNDFVDVVAFTIYGDPLGMRNGSPVRNVAGNDILIGYGKPIAVAEIGPGSPNITVDGTKYIDYVKDTYPTASYIVPWQSFAHGEGKIEKDAWVDTEKLTEAMHHSYAVNRSGLAYKNMRFTPNDPTPSLLTNLAINSRSHASHGDDTAKFAIDGNIKTEWNSGLQPPAETWLSVDLGKSQSISRIRITWRGIGEKARDYRLQLSDDQVHWHDAVIRVGVTKDRVDDLIFPTKKGQYVRILTESVIGADIPYYGYGVAELEIFEADLSIPVRPTGIVAKRVSPTEVALSWQDNASNEQGFQIELRVGEQPWTVLTTVPPNTEIHSVTTPGDAVSYSFRVAAIPTSGGVAGASQDLLQPVIVK